MRTVKTSSGATAVQIVWSSRRGSRRIEHLGSAHDDAELEALKAAAAQRLAEGQQVLDLGLADNVSGGAPLEIISSQASHLWDGLCRAYGVLGFDSVLARASDFRLSLPSPRRTLSHDRGKESCDGSDPLPVRRNGYLEEGRQGVRSPGRVGTT